MPEKKGRQRCYMPAAYGNSNMSYVVCMALDFQVYIFEKVLHPLLPPLLHQVVKRDSNFKSGEIKCHKEYSNTSPE